MNLSNLLNLIEKEGPNSCLDWEDHWSLMSIDFVEQIARRQSFIKKFSYAVPTELAINKIIDFSAGSIVEIGAGKGLWAYLIELAGGKIRATDLHTSENRILDSNPYPLLCEAKTTWTNVQQTDAAQAVTNTIEQTLLTIWPCYKGAWAGRALQAFAGQRIIYIGEGEGGCTADDEFHNILKEKWNLIDDIAIPQWPAIHDSMYLYSRK